MRSWSVYARLPRVSNKLNTKASGVVAVAVMCSRVLGLVREMLFAGLFGTTLMGIFTIAFRAPNLLRDLFAEGALSTAFITVFSKKIEREGDKSAWELAGKMMTIAVIFMSIVSILGIVFADQFIWLLAPGLNQADRHLTVLLTQVMYPFILLVSLAALVMGMLNAKNVFGVPAMASSFFNIGSIVGGVVLGWMLDPKFGETALIGLAIGTLIGGFLQLVIQFPSLRAVGFRFKPDFRWRDPGIRSILVLMVPSVIAASAVQINVMINTGFATKVSTGAVAWLNFAFRFMQLPIGIFGVAVATITLPVIARIAAHEDRSEFGPTLGKAMRLAIFLTLPSAVGLYFLAEPIIGLIYERGQFHHYDTLQTAIALQFYAMGLVAYSCIKVLSPAFYAIDRKWTPMMVSFASIGVNAFLNYLFIVHWKFGHKGLALSTTIAATLNFGTLYLLMHKEAGTLHTTRMVSTLIRCGLASAALGALAWAGVHYGHEWIYSPHLLIKIASIMSLIALAAAGYILVCLIFRVDEVSSAWNAVGSKVMRRFRR